jgi:RNA polymerase sigma-70 factor (ECF subfamily)
MDRPDQGLRNPGDGESWRRLNLLYWPLIEGYARRLGVAEHGVDDVVQDVLVKVWQKLRSFDPERGPFRDWLRGIARYTIRDWHRSRDPSMSLDDVPEVAERPSEDRWGRLERQLRILGIVHDRLRSQEKPRDWWVYVQIRLKRRSARDVAEESGLTRDNVYQISTRVFARVRALCLEYDEDLSDDATQLPE